VNIPADEVGAESKSKFGRSALAIIIATASRRQADKKEYSESAQAPQTLATRERSAMKVCLLKGGVAK
jgi:hypothetical protein